MQSSTQAAPGTQSASKRMLWTGRIISALPVILLVATGIMALMKPPTVVANMVRLGYPERLTVNIGMLEIACAIIYAIPRTSVLGAILVTGYLGGATATHVRMGEPFFMPVIVGVMVWGGLFLREKRLRALVPLRSST